VRTGKLSVVQPAHALPSYDPQAAARDRAIIAVLLGCAPCRCAVATLTDGRWSGGFTPEATAAARHANTSAGLRQAARNASHAPALRVAPVPWPRRSRRAHVEWRDGRRCIVEHHRQEIADTVADPSEVESELGIWPPCSGKEIPVNGHFIDLDGPRQQ